MKYKRFRCHLIQRSCTEKYKDYHQYLRYLAKDFGNRCAYCNTIDNIMSQNFVVDHFIPRKYFINTDREELEIDYNNLMYSCPKCNIAKSSQYDGDINDGTYNNNYFYNPIDTNYDEIFFRNEFGTILSDDTKGKDMIIRLKLFSPIYNLAFLIEEIKNTLAKIKIKIDKTSDIKEKQYYDEAYIKLNEYLLDLQNLFNCNYYKNSVKIKAD